MNPVLDNKDEESVRHAQRAKRIEQMRREKQLQEERRRMLKKLLPPVAGVLGVIVMIVVAVTVFGGNAEANDEKMNTSEIQAQVGNEESDVSEAQLQARIEMTPDQTGVTETMEMTKEEIAVLGGGVTATGEVAPAFSFESTSDSATIYSENVISPNAILINESTDTIVASKGAKQRICPASMTKVLTVLVAAENIDMNKLDDTFTMTKEITDYAYVNDCSSVGFLDGEKVTIRDLFYGTIMPSGGDAAVGLATYVAGSHEAFVDMMNAKVDELGLSESAHFTNCVGLYDDNLYCTVYDMAVIMKAALQNEFLKEVLSAKRYTTSPTTEHPEGISISNWFLRRIEDKDTGGEVLCAKTGYVNESGNCAVSYGTSADGVPYICVTAGATSSWRCIYDHVEIYNRYVE